MARRPSNTLSGTAARRQPEPITNGATAVAVAVEEEDLTSIGRRFSEAELHFHRIEMETKALRSGAEPVDFKAAHLRAEAIKAAATAATASGVSAEVKALLSTVKTRSDELIKLVSRPNPSDPRLAKIDGSIASLRALVATLPDLAAVFGVSQIEGPAEPAKPMMLLPAPANVPEKSVEVNETRNRYLRKDLESATPPRFKAVAETDTKVELEPVESLGKVRFRAVGPDGKPVSLVTAQVIGELSNNGQAVLAHGGTTKSGYAAFDISAFDAEAVTRILIRFPTSDGKSVDHDITVPHRTILREAGTPHIITLQPGGLIPSPTGTIESPDEADAANAPEEYQFDTHMHGESCCMRPSSNVPARQFFARQIVRLRAPSLVSKSGLVPRVPVQAPIDYLGEGPSTYAVLAGTVALGRAVTYRQSWRPIKHGLGRLLYSLPLAPREQVKLAVIDWDRRDTVTRRESTQVRESLSFDQHRDRTVDETVSSVLEEEQSGSSATVSGGGGLNLFGIISIGGGGGGSTSSTDAYRSLVSSTRQRIADNTSQRAASLRSLQSTVVTVATQQETESIRTRIVQNHNINHALTMHYYEVLAHYRVVTDVHQEQGVVLIPYAIDPAIFDTIPSFDKFRLAPSRAITRFLLRHRRVLDPLLPERFDTVFDSLTRLVLAPDVYNIKPKAFVSKWTVELEQSMRTGVRLFIETTDGQTVPLRPQGGSTTTVFTSDPVDVGDIASLRVVFNPSEAVSSPNLPGFLGDLVDALKTVIEFKLTRVSVQVRTDRSQYVPNPRNFAVGAAPVNATLSSSNPSTSIGLTVSQATLDSMFEDWNSQAHRDYGRLQELIAYIQAHPMRFMRAIWLAEDPDRRALRFDQFNFNGSPLLDQIENRPIGTLGNMVAFPLLEDHKLVPATNPNLEVSSRFVSLPTRGVFAEVYLSCCNATEIRDPTRVIDIEALRELNAPDIDGITPRSRFQSIATSPTTLPQSLVSIQAPVPLPDPTGLAKTLEVLGKADLFKDMSGLDKLSDSVKSHVEKAFADLANFRQTQADIIKAYFSMVGDLGKATLDAAGKILPSLAGGAAKAAGAAAGAAGGAGGAAGGGAAAGGLLEAAASAAPLLMARTAPDAGTAATAAHLARSSNPRAMYDAQFLTRKAVNDGLITKEQGSQVLTALFGGTEGAAFVPASFIATTGMPDEPSLRTCCHVGTNAPIDPSGVGSHVYGGGRGEANGFIYTAAGGLIDTAHARHCADLTGYIAYHAARLLGSGGTLSSAHSSFGMFDGPWTLSFNALNQTPDPELCVALGQRIAYELATWHEIWTFWSLQSFSSFSPEDNFSNLLGTVVGADALRDTKPFDQAVTAAFNARLTGLGAKPVADTATFITKIRANPGQWFQPAMPFDQAARRHLAAFPKVTPWLDKGVVAPTGLDVPQSEPTGGSLAALYTLTIDPTKSGIPPADMPGGVMGFITPADFAHLIGRVRAQFLAGGGVDTP